MIDTGIINMFYFYAIKAKAEVERNRVRLKGIAVDPEVLRQAVQKAVDRNYYFGLTPVLNAAGQVFFEKNKKPVEVYPDNDTYAVLGTEETNGYLFRVLYTKDSIGVSHFHALSDGRGAIAFLVSILYYYLTLTGHTVSPQGVLCDKTPEEASERDILTDQIPEGLTYKGADIPGEVFVVPEGNALMKTPYTKKIDIAFPAKQLLSKAKEYDATPVPFVSVLAGRAIDRVYGVGEQTVTASVLVDMHEMNHSRALSNYCSNLYLPLTADVRDGGMKEAVDDQKRWLVESNTPDKLFAKLCELKMMEPMMRKTPLNDPQFLKAAMKGDAKVGKARATYFLTNVGKVRFPADMTEFIDSCDFNSMNTGTNPILSLMTLGDKGHIYVTQNFEALDLAEAICAVMNENAIDAVCTDCGLTRADTVEPARFATVSGE